jgi:putative FmdB family regulatory protein
MPTYEYICEKCNHQFEVFQSMSDKPLTSCSKELCKQKTWGKGKVKKLIGAGAGLIFKGSGFYITDYRSENYKAAAKKDSAAPSTSSGGESKSSSSSETKSTAPKSEPKKAKAKE